MSLGNEVFQLSYSAESTYLTCPFRYAAEKIYRLPIDEDASDDTTAFRWGKVVHGVMEDTDWNGKNYTEKIFEAHLLEQGFMRKMESGKIALQEMKDNQLVFAMFAAIQSLYAFSKKQKLKTVCCEFKIDLPWLLGYIDQICVDENGFWWIRDLKTSGRISEKEYVRLSRDRQCNVYAHPEVLELIEKELGLAHERFMGVRYTVVFKTTAVVKAGETREAYAKRTKPKIVEAVIPKEGLDPKKIKSEHIRSIETLNIYRNDKTLEPPRVFGGASCYSYMRPCPYWSRCYGKTYTESEKELEIVTLDTVKPVLTPLPEHEVVSAPKTDEDDFNLEDLF